jgi:hypothetical protein
MSYPAVALALRQPHLDHLEHPQHFRGRLFPVHRERLARGQQQVTALRSHLPASR